MPELPEVEVIRRSLAPSVLGRRVLAVEACDVRLREGVVPAQWPVVVGQSVEDLERRGKYLALHLQTASVLFHLGMSGRLVVTPPSTPQAPHTHLVVRFERDLELRFVDPRRFGAAVVLSREALAEHAGLRRLGPDAWSGDVTSALLEARRSRAPIRSVLLDQSVIAGLGNIYANEALARAGIRPTRPVRAVSPARLGRLALAIADVLGEAVAAGGTTLADGGFVAADGSGGYFAVRLAVYGRDGEPCRVCGAPIVRGVRGNRSLFYCPRCQR